MTPAFIPPLGPPPGPAPGPAFGPPAGPAPLPDELGFAGVAFGIACAEPGAPMLRFCCLLDFAESPEALPAAGAAEFVSCAFDTIANTKAEQIKPEAK